VRRERTQERPNDNPDSRQLRQFGITLGLALLALFGALLPLLRGRPLPWWPWAPALLLFLCSAIHPPSLAPVYRLWMQFGRLMGRITTPLVLAGVFMAAVVPTALIRRWLGRDSLCRQLEPDAVSYRVASRRRARRDMEKPY
jgi:O-antigen/teichoic acid export membrane protein